MIVAPPTRLAETSSLTARIVPALELGKRELAAWEEFRSASPWLSSPFMSSHYIQAVAAVRPYVYVCVLTRGSHIAGFLPFQFRSALHRALRTAERVGEEMSDYFGIIGEPGFHSNVQELLRLANLNCLYFSHMDQSQLDYGLEGEQPEIGLFLDLEKHPNSWEQIRTADKKLASETERLERKVQREHGPMRFCFQEQDWQAALANVIQRKGDQYVRTGNRDLFATSWRQQLLNKVAGMHESGCSGVLSTLHAGDVWIASHFGIRSGEVLQYWFPVYNAAMKQYAPGRLLFKQVMQSARQAGIRFIDRGAGDTQTKRQLSNSEHFFYRGLWQRSGTRSLPGRLVLSASWRFSGKQRKRVEHAST